MTDDVSILSLLCIGGDHDICGEEQCACDCHEKDKP